MNIGKMIKDARERQGLSMNSLARLSGVPQSSISEIEAGKRQPSFDSVERIVSALGFSPFAAFFSADKPELEPEMRRLAEAARGLNKAQLDLVFKLIAEMKGK